MEPSATLSRFHATHGPDHAGALLKGWRNSRRLSQLELAAQANVSTRHLSFVETGRAQPSPELIVSLGIALEIPLRDRNRMLLAAGFAPRYQEKALDSEDLLPVKQALRDILALHDPNPGLVLDRQWNVMMANSAAGELAALLPEFLRAPVMNVFRASLHPQGLAPYVVNFDEWATALVLTLRRTLARSGDLGLQAIEEEVTGYANVAAVLGRQPPGLNSRAPLLIPCVLDLPTGRRSYFTTLTVFGTPQEVTLEELSIELFYPLRD
jgi:transcriptional regulator with XRE-family HTH domain